jgi:cytoskeletal protein RodZ
MPNQQLLEYIRAQRALGATKGAIVAALASSGWRAEDVAAAWLVATEPELPAAPVQAIPPTIQPQPLQAAAIVSRVQVAQPNKSSPILRITVGILLALVIVGAWGAAIWYRQSMQQPASAPQTSPDSQASAQGPVQAAATTTPSAPAVEPLATYSFTPSASNIPGFSLGYPPSLGTPQTKESAVSFKVKFGTSTDTLTLSFSLFANPLSPSQSAPDYLQSIYPTANLTNLSTNGRTILKVLSHDFAKNQFVYYIFLKNASVMTVEATGSTNAFDTMEDGLIQSLQFADSAY